MARVKRLYDMEPPQLEGLTTAENFYEFRTSEQIRSAYEEDFVIPKKFLHVDLDKLRQAEGAVDELKAVLGQSAPLVHSALWFSRRRCGGSALSGVDTEISWAGL